MDNALMREEISKIKAIPSLKVRKPRLDILIRVCLSDGWSDPHRWK